MELTEQQFVAAVRRWFGLNEAVRVDASYEALTNELREFVAAEWGYQQQLLPSVGVPLSFGTGVATAEQVYAAAMSRPFQGRLLSEWASGIEAQRMTRIRDAVRIGYVENESVQQIVRRVRGTRAAGCGTSSPSRRSGSTRSTCRPASRRITSISCS